MELGKNETKRVYVLSIGCQPARSKKTTTYGTGYKTERNESVACAGSNFLSSHA